MEKQKIYWSTLFQCDNDTDEIERLLETMPSYSEAIAFMGEQYDYYTAYGDYNSELSEFTDYEPCCANNGTDIYIGSGNGYHLLLNNTLGGVYVLYREATEYETELYYETKNN